jgi:hypothetical protein
MLPVLMAEAIWIEQEAGEKSPPSVDLRMQARPAAPLGCGYTVTQHSSPA